MPDSQMIAMECRIFVGLILVSEAASQVLEDGVSPVRVGLATLAVVGLDLWRGQLPWYYIAAGMLPGVILCLCSLLTEGGVGGGNGLIFLLTGAALGPYGNLLLFLLSLVLFLMISAVLRVRDGTGAGQMEYLNYVCLAYVPAVVGQYYITLECV